MMLHSTFFTLVHLLGIGKVVQESHDHLGISANEGYNTLVCVNAIMSSFVPLLIGKLDSKKQSKQ